MAAGKIFPSFQTGPSAPRNQPEKIFFPARTSDGSALTVRNASAPYVQPSRGANVGVPVPYNRPSQYLQTVRVYEPARRFFRSAF